jgi:hypothetical protein
VEKLTGQPQKHLNRGPKKCQPDRTAAKVFTLTPIITPTPNISFSSSHLNRNIQPKPVGHVDQAIQAEFTDLSL